MEGSTLRTVLAILAVSPTPSPDIFRVHHNRPVGKLNYHTDSRGEKAGISPNASIIALKPCAY